MFAFLVFLQAAGGAAIQIPPGAVEYPSFSLLACDRYKIFFNQMISACGEDSLSKELNKNKDIHTKKPGEKATSCRRTLPW